MQLNHPVCLLRQVNAKNTEPTRLKFYTKEDLELMQHIGLFPSSYLGNPIPDDIFNPGITGSKNSPGFQSLSTPMRIYCFKNFGSISEPDPRRILFGIPIQFMLPIKELIYC